MLRPKSCSQNPHGSRPMSLQAAGHGHCWCVWISHLSALKVPKRKNEKGGVYVGMDGGPTNLWWVYVHIYIYIMYIYIYIYIYVYILYLSIQRRNHIFVAFQLPTKLIQCWSMTKKWVPHSADMIFSVNSATLISHTYDPCMVYLPTFAIKIN